MAKRFFDSGKYNDPFFRKLSPEMKCAYDYLQCNCNYAGVIDIDIDDMNFKIGCNDITYDNLAETFADKFVILNQKPDGLKIFMPKFIYWQYKNELIPTNGVHRNVFEQLEFEAINTEPYLAPFVAKEDFRNWKDLYPSLAKMNKKYKDWIKEERS